MPVLKLDSFVSNEVKQAITRRAQYVQEAAIGVTVVLVGDALLIGSDTWQGMEEISSYLIEENTCIGTDYHASVVTQADLNLLASLGCNHNVIFK